MAIETVLAGILLEATTSAAVELVSKRTIDPKIKMVGGAYRCFSLFNTVQSLSEAIRISAYTDVGNIVAKELVIEFTSNEIQGLFKERQMINFDVIRDAEKLLVSQDNADQIASTVDPIDHAGFSNYISTAIGTSGGNLVELALSFVHKAIASANSAFGVVKVPDSQVPRRTVNWDRSVNFLDKINTGLGYALWMPVPEIGVGTGVIYNNNIFDGIYRRNEPEGFGRIRFTSGDVYIGQIRRHDASGYGVFRTSDGTILAGNYSSPSEISGLRLSPDRRFARLGFRLGTKQTHGLAIEIDIENRSIVSFGFWNGNSIHRPIETKRLTLERLIRNFESVERRYGAHVVDRNELRNQVSAEDAVVQDIANACDRLNSLWDERIERLPKR